MSWISRLDPRARRGRERPLASIPRAYYLFLAVALAGQIAWSTHQPPARAQASDLPSAPATAVLAVAALGEPVALGKALMLWLQAFDYRAGSRVPYRELDYGRLIGWLAAILELDPGGQYPLASAARLYAEIPDPPRQRQMLEFIHDQYLLDPNRRWPWLAHAAVLAKHRLNDLALARRFAVTLQKNTTSADVPLWATQMEAFILEDMNELEAARIMIGGLLEKGQVRDARDAQLLERRLKMLEKRLLEERRSTR